MEKPVYIGVYVILVQMYKVVNNSANKVISLQPKNSASCFFGKQVVAPLYAPLFPRVVVAAALFCGEVRCGICRILKRAHNLIPFLS